MGPRQSVAPKERGKGLRSVVTGCVQTRRSDDTGPLSSWPVSACLYGVFVERLSNTSGRVDLKPAVASTRRSKLRPDSGEPKERPWEGATMGRAQAWGCRIRWMRLFMWSGFIRFYVRPAGARHRQGGTGCRRKPRAVAPCHCRAFRSAPACGLGGRGGWSVAAGPGWCRR